MKSGRSEISRSLLPVTGLLFIAMTQVSYVAYAGVNEWTSVGPDGGWVFDAAFDPTNSSTLYATAPSGFYRSVDGGRTWHVTKDDFLEYPGAIAVSAANPQRLLVTNANKAFLSTDGGTTFTSPALAPAPANTFRVEISKDGQTAYLAAGLHIYRSTDQGQTWSQRAPLPGGFDGALVNGLEIDPANANVAYASSYQLGILVSDDGGASWRSLTNTYPDLAQPHNFVIDPANSQRLLAATERGLFVSNDRGVSWASTGITEQLSDIDVDPTSSGTLYVSTISGRVKKSIDGGATWSLLPVTVSGFREAGLAIAPTQSSHLMLLGGNGVLLSEDAGATWESRNTGLVASAVFGLTSTADRIYASARTAGIYAIAAGSSSVSAVNNSALRAFSPLNSVSIVNVTRPDNTLLAVLDSQVFVGSEDAGQSWNAVTGYPGLFAPSVLASAPDSQTVYAASGERIFKSDSAGSQWIEVSNGLPLDAYSLVSSVAPTSNPAIVYAAVQIGLSDPLYRIYKTVDGAASWTRVGPDFSDYVFKLSAHPENDQILYAGSSFNLRRSTDGGVTWSTTASPSSSYYDIKFDNKNPRIVYAVGGLVVSRSVDAGASWQSLGYVVPSFIPQLTSLAIDPSRSDTVFVGTQGFGIKQMTLAPDIALNLSAPAALTVNTSSTYTLMLRNSGPYDATNVRVSANLPAGASAISASGTGAACAVVDTIVTCTFDVLRSGAAATTLTVRATPTAAGSFALAASVSGDQSDGVTSNNSVASNLTVNASSSAASSGTGGGGAVSTEWLLLLAALTAGVLGTSGRHRMSCS